MKPYYDHDGITIYHGDCREVLPTLRNVDLVLTDPPYEVGKGAWDVLPAGALKAAFDKTTGAMLVFWSAFDLSRVPLEIGEKPKNCLVWHKPNLQALWMFDRSRLASQWEPIFYFAKPGFEPKKRPTDVWSFNTKSDNKFHPTEKPLELIVGLIECFGGDTVLDPFMGSGTTLRAAKDLRRRAIGIETEESFCEIAAKRLRQEVFDF